MWGFLFLGVTVFLTGCAHCGSSAGRPYALSSDSLAFRNELVWTYGEDSSGRAARRGAFAHHCFPMARITREFFYHARFDPTLPPVGPEEYEKLARRVVRRNSRCPPPPSERIVIPGFRDLREFSAAHESLLKSQGGAWRSYFQRGNWRMVFPIPAARQRATARQLAEELGAGRLPIVHVFTFPRISINHALLLYAVEDRGEELLFLAYDPNDPSRPARLAFDRREGAFLFERNHYFSGGPVKVYEVYRSLCY